MAGEWKTMTLREAGVSLIDCDHRTPPAAGTGYPYIAIPQLKHGRLDLSEVRRITRGNFIDWTRKAKPQPYDVILSRRCNPGETAFVPPGFEGALGQNLVLLRADGTAVFQPFLRWLVRGPQWWEQMGKFLNVGAVFDSLRCADIPGLTLPIPPLAEQRAIAHILGTLDDKIELNRRMNETLEAIARALFDSWFVRFDPVRRNMERKGRAQLMCAQPSPAASRHPLPRVEGNGRANLSVADAFPLPPGEGQGEGSVEELDRLFPDSFEDSELGEIPKGWRVRPFADTVEIIGGGTPKTSVAEYWNGDIPWFSVVDAPTGSDVWVVDTEKKITREGVAGSSTRVLPVGATIISARGTVGKIALVGVPMAMNQSCYGLSGKVETHGVFTYFATRELVTSLQQHAHGSVFDTITRDTLAGVSLALPPTAVIEAFETQVGPTLERIRGALIESRTLATLRDTLLPQLLSGQIRPGQPAVSIST